MWIPGTSVCIENRKQRYFLVDGLNARITNTNIALTPAVADLSSIGGTSLNAASSAYTIVVSSK